MRIAVFKRTLLGGLIGLAASVGSSLALADPYPSRVVTERHFAPVGGIMKIPTVLAVRADSPAIVDLAKIEKKASQ
jgi:hypothetical protein